MTCWSSRLLAAVSLMFLFVDVDLAAEAVAGSSQHLMGEAEVAVPGPPWYPREAVEQRLQGCAVASFVILSDGHADQYQVIDSVPKGTFDVAIVRALEGYRFKQPTRPGRYAKSMIFKLQSDDKEEVGIPMERDCIAIPNFESLNPTGREKH